MSINDRPFLRTFAAILSSVRSIELLLRQILALAKENRADQVRQAAEAQRQETARRYAEMHMTAEKAAAFSKTAR